jgi:hypothetical protein
MMRVLFLSHWASPVRLPRRMRSRKFGLDKRKLFVE